MLNQVIILGRIKSIEETSFVLAVQRSYKNENGEYDTDYLPVDVSEALMKNMHGYCNVGDMVGVKGTLRTKHNQLIIYGEKLTFLASSNGKEEKPKDEQVS